MGTSTSQFQGDEAKFTLRSGGDGQLIKASDLVAAGAGLGVFVPQWRDYTWEHIAGVTKVGDKYHLVYVTLSERREEHPHEQGVSRNITVREPKETTMIFDADDQVLVSKRPIAKPQGRRTGTVTYHINEDWPTPAAGAPVVEPERSYPIVQLPDDLAARIDALPIAHTNDPQWDTPEQRAIVQAALERGRSGGGA